VTVIDDPIVGDARNAAAAFVERHAPAGPHSDQPICIIASGETTVRVTGSGRGGRNQEFALAAAEALSSRSTAATLASVGTDGVDGVTDAAGAAVDSETVARARGLGLGSPKRYLDDNDSHAFFSVSGELIRTGPTGTNVGDLQVLLID
jgi:hydroxypyruvate reductase